MKFPGKLDFHLTCCTLTPGVCVWECGRERRGVLVGYAGVPWKHLFAPRRYQHRLSGATRESAVGGGARGEGGGPC